MAQQYLVTSWGGAIINQTTVRLFFHLYYCENLGVIGPTREVVLTKYFKYE